MRLGKARRIVSPEGGEWEGAVAVTFEEEESAKRCVSTIGGRYFDGRQVEAEFVGGFWNPPTQPQTNPAQLLSEQEETPQAQTQVHTQPQSTQQHQQAVGTVVIASAPPDVRK